MDIKLQPLVCTSDFIGITGNLRLFTLEMCSLVKNKAIHNNADIHLKDTAHATPVGMGGNHTALKKKPPP